MDLSGCTEGIICVAKELLLRDNQTHPEFFTRAELDRYILKASRRIAFVRSAGTGPDFCKRCSRSGMSSVEELAPLRSLGPARAYRPKRKAWQKTRAGVADAIM